MKELVLREIEFLNAEIEDLTSDLKKQTRFFKDVVYQMTPLAILDTTYMNKLILPIRDTHNSLQEKTRKKELLEFLLKENERKETEAKV